MSKKIVELYSIDFEDQEILVGTDVFNRELHFFIESEMGLTPVSDDMHMQLVKHLNPFSDLIGGIKESIDYVAKKYLEKNNKLGFSSLNMLNSLDNLIVKCSDCSLEESSASYEAFSNRINFNLPSCFFTATKLNFQLYLVLHQIIAHETGHLSVSDIGFDDEGNLVVSAGFLQKKIPIMETFKIGDDIEYYRLDTSKEFLENEGRGIEELFNTLEADEVSNGATATNFAHRLDKLTEGKLRIARRNHSLPEYYDIMQGIIPSQERASLLLVILSAYYNEIDGNDKDLCAELNNIIERILDDYEISLLSSRPKKGVSY